MRTLASRTYWLTGICLAFYAAPVAAETPSQYYRQIIHLVEAWVPEEAVGDAAKLAKQFPDDPISRLASAQVHFQLGRYREAAAEIDKLEAMAGKVPAYASISELIRTTEMRTRGMVSQRSENFEIFAQPGQDELLMPFALETLEAQLAALTADFGYQIPKEAKPLRIEIYPKVLDFVSVSTLTEKEVSTSGTIALCKFNRMMIISPRRLARGYKWRDTLGHELVHMYLSRMTRNKLPLWMHEGVAKFTEHRWRSNRVGDLHPIQESILAEGRRTKTFVEFSDMMPSLAKLDSGWKTSLAFAEVTLLIKQIVEDGGIVRLRQAIEAFSQSQEAGFALLGAADLDDMWGQFVARLQTTPLNPVPGYKFIPLSVAEDPEAAEPEPIVERNGRKYLRLGDLLRNEGHWLAAITEYTKAAEHIGHKPAQLQLRIAEAQMVGGRYLQAEQELLSLLTQDPDRATAHWLLGKIALFRQDPKEALSRYETAFGISPFHRDVLDGLVTAAEKLDDKEKLKAYRKALEIFNAHGG